jgi:hypothetical protein
MNQFLSIFWSVSASDLLQHLPASTSRPDKSGSSVLPCARAATLLKPIKRTDEEQMIAKTVSYGLHLG